MMENKTDSDILSDMVDVVLRRARKAELAFTKYRDGANLCVWNEYKVLLDRLNLYDRYLEMYE